jgi:capsular polysaccharide biosynthesis protein/glycerol-3-phosphate cytidylyltransferase-like family protein
MQKPPAVPEVGHHEPLRRSIFGALARGWWRILLLWILISMPVAYLIYASIEPTYEAVSRLRIEPYQRDLFDTQSSNALVELRIYEPYLQTQINLITSDNVLNRAIANHSLANLPPINGSEDAKTDLRENMVVKIEPNTYLISVALQSRNPNAAAAIVNAVVATYIDENNRYTQSRNSVLKANLYEEVISLRNQIDKKTAELQELHQKRTVQIHKPPLNADALKDGEGVAPMVAVQDQEQINALITQMVQIDLDLLISQANLKSRKLERDRKILRVAAKALQGADLQPNLDGKEVEKRVVEAFYDDPDVIALSKEIKKVEDELDRLKLVPRQDNEQALQAARRELTELEGEWKELWSSRSEKIRRVLRTGAAWAPEPDLIAALEDKIKGLREKRFAFAKLYEMLKVEQKTINDDSFKFAYAQQGLTNLINREEQVRRNLAQVEFQSRLEPYRVVLIDKAEVPKVPVNNKRLKYMAIAPLAILLVLLAGFLVSEVGERRRARAVVGPPPTAPVAPTFREVATSGDKMVGISYACRRAQQVQRAGGKVALVEGRFERIDYSAAHLLQFARMQGNFLIVGIESDASIQRSAEPGSAAVQSSVPQDQRVYLLSLYSFVDLVVTFDRQIPLNLIEAIRPDVLVTWADPAPDSVRGAEFVRSYGGRLAMCPQMTGA